MIGRFWSEKKVFVYDALVDESYQNDDPGRHRWRSIQNGLNHAPENGLIYVYNGTYYEDIIVNKSTKLYGENRDGVIIYGSNIGVNIINGSLYMHGFTIRDGKVGVCSINSRGGNVIKNCILYHNSEAGILFDNTSFNTVSNCNISLSDYGIEIINNSLYNIVIGCNITTATYGVYIEDSSWNTIGSMERIYFDNLWSNCNFILNDYAIYLYNTENNTISGCYIEMKHPFISWPPTYTEGITLVNSDDNTIVGCNLFNATDCGIQLAASSRNTIKWCKIRENEKGVYLVGASDNVITGNTFLNNTQPAITMDGASGNNIMYWNDFLFNGWGGRPPLQAYDSGKGNIWYEKGDESLFSLSSGEGNYWVDYNGNDTNGDGVGDTPYTVPGPAGSQDLYPMMQSYNWENLLEVRWR